jgi:hypothetical protein
VDLQLHGKRVLVTGSGSGIGLAIAGQFAAEGCAITICGRTRSALDAALERRAGFGGTAVAHVVDVADGAAIGLRVGAAAQELGGLDVVVHNASGASDLGEEAWRRNIDIDVLGFSRLVAHATPHLARSSAASVVAMSSTAAVEAFGNPAALFGTMKAALTHQCASLSKTLRSAGDPRQCGLPRRPHLAARVLRGHRVTDPPRPAGHPGGGRPDRRLRRESGRGPGDRRQHRGRRGPHQAHPDLAGRTDADPSPAGGPPPLRTRTRLRIPSVTVDRPTPYATVGREGEASAATAAAEQSAPPARC